MTTPRFAVLGGFFIFDSMVMCGRSNSSSFSEEQHERHRSMVAMQLFLGDLKVATRRLAVLASVSRYVRSSCAAFLLLVAVLGGAQAQTTISLPSTSFVRGENVALSENGYGTDTLMTAPPYATAPNAAEWDFVVPVTGTYELRAEYAASTSRPVVISFNGITVFTNALAATTGGWFSAYRQVISQGVITLTSGAKTMRVARSDAFPHIKGFTLVSTAAVSGPTGLLNDTGQTKCYDGSAMVACTSINTGDGATYPRQDGRFGRDAANPVKVGEGDAGFDFTKLCMNGTLNCPGAANTGASPAATDWACTKDNVTNLIWSLQTQGPVTWADATASTYPEAGHNSISRCGFSDGWRLPTMRELLGIVHYGISNGPMVDVNFFPATQSSIYWAGETYAVDTNLAWSVYFNYTDYGKAYAINKTLLYIVRLVRSGL